MRKNTRNLVFGVFSLALIVLVFGSYVVVAQTMTGTWSAKTRVSKKDPGGEVDREKIYLSFSRETAKGGHNQHSSDIAYADLEGLSYEKAQGGGQVSFRMTREAGTVECQGSFTGGSGSGTFTFTANQGFVDGMKTRGFIFSNEQLFSAATINVTIAAADDLKSAGFGPVGVDDLFKVVIFKVAPQFMAEMKATGFPNLNLEDLVKARIFKIDADYVRQVRDMGFEKEDFEGLVKFRIFKVTPEFLTELKNQGFGNLTAEEVVKCRIFKVTPDFLASLKNEGFANLSIEEVVKFRIFNIDTEFIRSAKAENPNVTVEDLVQIKIGVRRK